MNIKIMQNMNYSDNGLTCINMETNDDDMH